MAVLTAAVIYERMVKPVHLPLLVSGPSKPTIARRQAQPQATTATARHTAVDINAALPPSPFIKAV